MINMQDFDNLVEKAARFPPLDSRFLALESYITGLSEFIKVTCDQTELRLKAKISSETDPISQGEMESELIQLQEEGRLAFSSTICGSALVSVYFAYEASVTAIFNHLALEKSLISFESYKKKLIKDRERIKYNKENLCFTIVAKAYSSEVLGLSLFGKARYSSLIEELRMLRNSYVHNGCSLDSLSQRTKQNILNGKYAKSLGYVGSTWHITPTGVVIFFEEIYESFKYFRSITIDKAIG